MKFLIPLILILISCGRPSTQNISKIKQIIGSDDRKIVANDFISLIIDNEINQEICSAFNIEQKGFLTASHCLKPDGDYSVRLPDGSINAISIIERYDLADVVVFDVDSSYSDDFSLTQGDTGTGKALFGFEPGLGFFMSKDGSMQHIDSNHIGVFLHTFDTVYGSSGSPIFNEEGEVIAIHVGSMIHRGSVKNVAIGLDSLADVDLSSLLDNGIELEASPNDLELARKHVNDIFPGAENKLIQGLGKLFNVSPETLSKTMKSMSTWSYIYGLSGVFESIPIGTPYQKVDPPFNGITSPARNIMKFSGFHVGDNDFASTSSCADKVAKVSLNSSKIYLPIKLKTLDPQGTLTFPQKIKVRFNGVCGIDNAGNQVYMVQKNGVGAGLPPRVGRTEIKDGSFSFEFEVYHSDLALVVESSQYEWGEYDDFIVESVEVEVSTTNQIDYESAMCSLKFYEKPNFVSHKFTYKFYKTSSVISTNGSDGRWAPINTAASLALDCDISYNAVFCSSYRPAVENCIYTRLGQIDSLEGTGISGVRKVVLCKSKMDCFKDINCSSMIGGCPSSSSPASIIKQIPAINSFSQMALAIFASEFYQAEDRYPSKAEIDSFIQSMNEGELFDDLILSISILSIIPIII